MKYWDCLIQSQYLYEVRVKHKKKNIGLILFFIFGFLILIYAIVSNAWNSYRANQLLSSYDKKIKSNQKKENIKMWEDAIAYNNELGIQPVPDAFSVRDGIHDTKYESLLNVNKNGIMGYVDIPSIKVKLPIYHYTTDESLSKGAGHLLGSSLPVGGEGTHAVVSAHRGLPTAEMFTNLPSLKKGKYFYFHVLDKIIAYKVDQILTVKPYHVSALSGEKGKDYATLITCTPYGVNTERLLVRGHRVPYNPKTYQKEKVSKGKIDSSFWFLQLLSVVIGLILAFVVVYFYVLFTKKK